MKKIALVTGARKGLGLAWVKILAKQGFTVYLTARKIDQAEQAAADIEGDVIPLQLDIMDERSMSAAVESVQQRHDRVDLLINNAGVNPKDHPSKEKMEGTFYLDKLSAEAMVEPIQANSIAPVLMMKHFRGLLRNADEPKVIHISSWLGSVTNTNMGVHFGYCGSKNLLNMLNKIASNELKEDGIISVCVNPGWVKTDMGGSKAEFAPEQSVTNVFDNVINKITIPDSGSFLNFDGTVHPW